MARTSAKAKKTKQEVMKGKEEAKNAKPDEPEQTEAAKDTDDSNGVDKENDGNVNYEVEKIVHTRIYHGKRQYLVRWKGYSEESDTWEYESDLTSCPDALEAFKKDNDTTNSDETEVENAVKGKKGKKNAKTSKGIVASSKSKDNESKSETKEKSDKEEDDGEEEEEEKVGSKKRAKGSKKQPAKKVKAENANSSTKKQVKIKKSEDSDDESVTDGKDYEVEKILEMHTKKDGSREFLIRWKGYRPSQDTWEPEAHLNCHELIEKFMEKVEQAKNIPTRELRESRVQTSRFEATTKSKRNNLRRNTGIRPSYAEDLYAE